MKVKIEMKLPKPNRWIYMLAVFIAAFVAGLAVELHNAASIPLALVLPVLTYPMGVIGAAIALPLIYSGIATPTEAFFLSAPVYAFAGMLQWYVVLPRVFSSNRAVD